MKIKLRNSPDGLKIASVYRDAKVEGISIEVNRFENSNKFEVVAFQNGRAILDKEYESKTPDNFIDWGK